MNPHAWFKDLPKPIIVAHRGSSLEAPENTLAAFNLASAQKAHAIELDVMLCGTGEPVVIHDDTLDRTTNGKGEVAKTPLAALKALDAGGWFDNSYSGETIPTLEEVFESVDRKLLINIELKNYRSPFDSLAVKVSAVVKRFGFEKRVFFSSFNPFNFRTTRRMVPQSPAGILLVKGARYNVLRYLLRMVSAYDAIHPEFSDASEIFIRQAQASGKPVFAYTINEAEDLQRLVELGCDGLITDNPSLAIQIAQTGLTH